MPLISLISALDKSLGDKINLILSMISFSLVSWNISIGN